MNYFSELIDFDKKLVNRVIDSDLDTTIVHDLNWEILEETATHHLVKSFWFKQNFSESMTDRVLMTTYH